MQLQEDQSPLARHIAVLLEEAVALLNVRADHLYVDATAGAGGHLQKICALKGSSEGIIALDRDLSALDKLRSRCDQSLNLKRIKFAHANFADLETVLTDLNVNTVDGGIIADLGLSSDQLDDGNRGFSFLRDGPLDMRMDVNSSSPTAHQLVNSLKETELADIIYKYGEERQNRQIARQIVNNRPVNSTAALAKIIESCRHYHSRRTHHPATKTFQALRIAVNKELENLQQFLKQSATILAPGARLVVITFHSLEDRIVKQFFKHMASNCICPPRQPICTCNNKAKFRILTPKPIVASEQELLANLRSRSAKLRAVEKLPQ